MIETLPSRRVRRVRARTDIIRQGSTPRVVSLLVEGWACRYKELGDGRRQILSLFLPNEICDTNVYMLDTMDHSIGALTDCQVAEVAAEDFSKAITEPGRMARVLWFNELRTMAVQREWTTNLGQRNARERLAHLLCETFLRLQHLGLVDGSRCAFPLTQVDLADATGLTAVHVNRTLQDLRHSRLIELSNRQLTVPDLAALKQAALFDDTYLHFETARRAGTDA